VEYIQEPTYRVRVEMTSWTEGVGWNTSVWEQTTFRGHADEISRTFAEINPSAKVTVRPATQAEHNQFELALHCEKMLRENNCGSMIR
jgi:hypothetical protein